MRQSSSQPERSATAGPAENGPAHTGVMEAAALGVLVDVLHRQGYTVLGPTLREGAVVYDELQTTDQLPVGWTDSQERGTYRLTQQDEPTLFGYAVGPTSWKRFLFPPRRRLWSATRGEEDASFQIHPEADEPRPTAFLGVRACELAALTIQDRIFMEGTYVDPVYGARRKQTLLIAVNCSHAAATCFCTSMGTGPQARQGYDLALTELLDGTRHDLFVKAGSEDGRALLALLPVRTPTEQDRFDARQVTARTSASMQRTMDTTDLHDLLLGNPEHPRWDDVAARCLACGNCTLVCPTCFCHTVEDVTDLDGQTAERWQTWDSCFTLDFSYLHGGSVRTPLKSRYRQWLTHKLASWIDQFGTSGCVGCGRCITWCPVGIDLTEEVHAIRESTAASPPTLPATGGGAR